MKRNQSPHSLASKAIKAELKKNFPSIKFSVTSDCFAGGNSVSIHYTDGPTRDKIELIVKKYQYGNFNSMEDIYEYSNNREDIPQVKYVSVSREISNEIKEKIKSQLKKNYPDFDSKKWMDSCQCWGSALIHREFSKQDF